MIELDEKWVITSDNYQWILSERYTIQSGENAGQEGFKNSTYHGTLSSAIDSYLKKCQKERIANGVYSLLEATKILEEEKNRVVKLYERMMGL